MSRLLVLCPIVAALLLGGPVPVAFAQSTASDKAAAEALFDDGKKLMIQGQYAEACDKLEQSQRIDPGIGTLLYLAECYEKGGRSASAWATFREAASTARAGGQADRARQGQQRANRLEPNLSKLTINVASEDTSLAGFEIRRGSELVPRSLWNVPYPVDPGEHVVEARAPGRKSFVQSVQVGAQAARAAISIPVLEIDPESSVTAPPVSATGPATVPEGGSPVAPSSPAPLADQMPVEGSQQRTVGLIVGGVGVVGLGVGTIFGLRAIGKNSDAEKLCEGTECFHGAKSLTDQAESAAMVSNVAFGLGAAALIGGAVLFFTAPSSASSSASARGLRLTPLASPQGGAMLLRGAF